MMRWWKKYGNGRRETWASGMGERAYELLGSGGMSREQLMKTLGISRYSLDISLRKIRSRIITVQFGKSVVYERKGE